MLMISIVIFDLAQIFINAMGEISWVFYSCGTLKELIHSLKQELICQEIQMGKQ